jgi:hypothetical protein
MYLEYATVNAHFFLALTVCNAWGMNFHWMNQWFVDRMSSFQVVYQREEVWKWNKDVQEPNGNFFHILCYTGQLDN